MHSPRRLEVSRRTNSASTICLAMSGNGMKIAGTTTTMVRRQMAVLGKVAIVVGALSAVLLIAMFRGSSSRPSAASTNRRGGTTAAGSAWPEHSRLGDYEPHSAWQLTTLQVARRSTGWRSDRRNFEGLREIFGCKLCAVVLRSANDNGRLSASNRPLRAFSLAAIGRAPRRLRVNC
jgi:hypothetical protein